MLALFVSVATVAVERFINRRRLKIYEIMRDVGWLTLVFALIEFAYLFIVESGTVAYGSAMRPLWYTEWAVFKDLFFDTAVAVLLILTSVWLESAGIAELRMRRPLPRFRLTPPPAAKPKASSSPAVDKCDVEW